ncbi:hypothetical protein OMP43_07790 [Sphingomonas sp. CBMAI 2297]|uniref:hypothetical protein n=1 Tax=Sphingomonas sp. CBMAI 2297 TaxID=2991720 RepID=UPI002458C266|nr:hypothetical protein [Sphingomonas sp. CBMAI 2297]MDH4743914.1 hypothetical protein [Sphingomonas sp. CBMAI 2297]
MILSTFAAMILSLWSIHGPAADDRSGAKCLKGLAPALIAGAFSGSIDCGRDQIAVRKIGNIRAGGRSFAIYDYRYKLRPVCPECASHGGRRIIVMTHGRYIGQYGVLDYGVRVTIRGGKLILSPAVGDSFAGAAPAAVRFSTGGPPKRIFFEEPIIFFR